MLTIFTAASGKLVCGLSTRQKYWIILRPLWATHHHHPPPTPNATSVYLSKTPIHYGPPDGLRIFGRLWRIPKNTSVKQLEA